MNEINLEHMFNTGNLPISYLVWEIYGNKYYSKSYIERYIVSTLNYEIGLLNNIKEIFRKLNLPC